MKITYKTNHANTSESMTVWYFGKSFVKKATEVAIKSGEKSYKVFQPGTGFLTVCIEK